ncbi:MAG: glycosyltransferase, partial [Anaerolineae bacterium]
REARRKSRVAAVAVNALGRARGWASGNLMLPDQYIAWLPHALREGALLIRQEGVDAIFATCPPHSAAVIGAALKRLTGKPLVLDYRDDWIDTPRHLAKPPAARAFERLQERWVVATADRVVLVTDWSRRAFVARYPRQPADKFALIPNGVDLEQFPAAIVTSPNGHGGPFRMVHAGLLSVADDWRRSPEALFRALAQAIGREPALRDQVRLTFTGRLPERYRQMADDMGLAAVVEETGYLSQPDLVRLMAGADMLLAINYEGFATLIPGKIYEYWAVGGPPVLSLSCEGAASDLIARHRLGLTVPPDDPAAIQGAILSTFARWQAGRPWRIESAGVEMYDRKALADRMASTLSAVAVG